MDPTKIQAITNWPRPKLVRTLRGFLGLARYYRKFIKQYNLIAKSLTKLLTKKGFLWTEEETSAFNQLKHALSSTDVLQLPDFTQPFIVECDASGVGFGAVLHQGTGAIAFFSRVMAPRHAKLATYEKELIGLVQTARHWRPY